MLAAGQFATSVTVAAVVVPAAVYFLLLGLLNSQRTPQLLRGRVDFIVLVAAFFPIFCVPVLNYFGASPWTLAAVVGGVAGTTVVLAPPRRGNWVIYNIAVPEAFRAAERALKQMGEPFTRTGRRLMLSRSNLKLHFTSVPLLRNVSLAASGEVQRDFHQMFERRLAEQLAEIRTDPTPTAVTFLLLATSMLVIPLGLFANRMPEMVRLITDLVR